MLAERECVYLSTIRLTFGVSGERYPGIMYVLGTRFEQRLGLDDYMLSQKVICGLSVNQVVADCIICCMSFKRSTKAYVLLSKVTLVDLNR